MTYDVLNPGKTHVTGELVAVYDELMDVLPYGGVDVYPDYLIVEIRHEFEDFKFVRLGDDEPVPESAQLWVAKTMDWEGSFYWESRIDDVIDIAGVLYRLDDCGVFGIVIGEC